MGCAHAGGHNIIGGLLDYLLERHPGSQLIGFKDGPGGILTKSFMDITEDIMVRIFSPSNSLLAKDSRSKYMFLSACMYAFSNWRSQNVKCLDLMTGRCIILVPITGGIPQ